MDLYPQDIFPIQRQLPDSADTNTYYVKAIIRKAIDNSLIEEIEMTDDGDGRFSSNWEVIQNKNPNGDFITITTLVYSDSGYTTLSAYYYREVATYLIFPKITKSELPYGGSSINYKKLREIIKEEVAMVEPPITPSQPVIKPIVKIDSSAFERRIGVLESLLMKLVEINIEMRNKPGQKGVNFAPVFKAIEEMKNKDIDLSSINKENKNIAKKLGDELKNVFNLNKKQKKEIVSEIIGELKPKPITPKKVENKKIRPFTLSHDKLMEMADRKL